MDYQQLVNQQHPLPPSYIPQHLKVVDNPYTQSLDPNHCIQLEQKTYDAFLQLQQQAKKTGYQILADSGYRSYQYQQQILDYFIEKMGDKAYQRVAIPGASEHQTGLAIDVALIINNHYIDDITGNEEAIKWLHQHAHQYGFILRYPSDKTEITHIQYEPWHIRYVGNPLATKMYEQHLVLEEIKNEPK